MKISCAILAWFAALLAPCLGQLELKNEPLPKVQPIAPKDGAEPAPAEKRRVRVIDGGNVIIGGNVVILDGRGGVFGDYVDSAATLKPDPAGPQVLEFADGTRLHGTVAALNLERQELTWRRADAAVPLVFPLPQIRRLTLGGESKEDINVHATVKFRGGDWLVADVTGIEGSKVRLKLGDGTASTVNRENLEWIYISKSSAPECYDGPTSLSGWNSNGGWSYRDGALRVKAATPIGRTFGALPDQVEYRLEIDQGGLFRSFSLMLHHRNLLVRSFSPGAVQIALRGTILQVWANVGNDVKNKQVDLSKVSQPFPELAETNSPNRKKPLRFRVFEDAPGGRLFVFINDRRAAEWDIGKREIGKNGGGFTWQPMVADETEQTLSKICIAPWDGRSLPDGASDDGAQATDRVVLAGGEMQEGRIASLIAGRLKLSTTGGVLDFPLEKISLLRFRRPENPADEAPPAAHVRLAQRGEFDASGLSWRDGKFVVRTNFGAALSLPPSAVREIEFSHTAWSPPKTNDVLVFRNGDRLSGVLATLGEDGKVGWRLGVADVPVQFETTHAAGVFVGPRTEKPTTPSGVFARFRNGDWLAGDLIALNKDHLLLGTAAAGQIEIAQPWLQTVYFSANGQPPVSDGASDHELWERGASMRGTISSARTAILLADSKVPETPGPWRYFDGSFSLEGMVGGSLSGTSINLGRAFDSLPERVEISFDVTASKTAVYFSARLFSEPDNPGYNVQFHSQGLFFYDLNPRSRGRVAFQQQVQFSGKVKPEARQRHVRFLAERTSGRLAIIVDGVLVSQVVPKAGEGSRNLGRGLMLIPQSNMPCTFSNLWIAPWNGQIPGKALQLESSLQTMVFVNGDDVRGTLRNATPTAVSFDSEAGPLDLPVERLTMIEFGGQSIEGRTGTRLRLAGIGALTVNSCRLENESVVCLSEVAGEMKLPLTAIQEVVFTGSSVPTRDENAAREDAAKAKP